MAGVYAQRRNFRVLAQKGEGLREAQSLSPLICGSEGDAAAMQASGGGAGGAEGRDGQQSSKNTRLPEWFRQR